MKKLITICAVVTMMLTANGFVYGAYLYTDSFEASWVGDYAAGWEDVAYRHGDASTSVMTQYSSVTVNNNTIAAFAGEYFTGLKVTNAGTPESSTNWWGAIASNYLNENAMAKEYSPWISVAFYDTGLTTSAAQLATVPTSDDDWTDTQIGERVNRPDHYWYVEAASGSGWLETTVARTTGWHTLKQAMNTAGYISYYIDDILVGSSTKTYDSLTGLYLMTQFNPGEFADSEVYFDGFQASSIPEPATIAVLSLGGLLLRRKK